MKIFRKTPLIICILILVIQVSIGQRSRNRKKGRRGQKSIFDTNLGGPENVTCNNETERRLDQTAAHLTNQKFPENAKELRVYCNRGLKSTGLVLGYVDQCLSEFLRRSIAVVMYPITSTIENVCKPGRPGRKARELIQASKCGNSARPQLRKCYNGFTDRELSILTVKDKKKRIAMLCCSINSLIGCFTKEIEEEKRCTRRTVEFVQTMTVDLFGDIMAMICRGYHDVNNEIPDLVISDRERPKSIVIPLIKLVRDFGEDDF